MLKKIGVVFAVVILSVWGATIVAPVQTGSFVYQHATELEAGLYGLQADQVDIGEMTMHLFRTELKEGRPTLLMLHGYSADKNVWTRFAKHFTEGYNVIVPDMAGHGATGFDPNWDYGGVAQVARLLKLLDELKIKKVHIIGNSMGGFIAAHFARLHPERTNSAALVDPAGVTSPEQSDMEKMLESGRNVFEISSREEFDEFYAMTMAQPPFFPDFILAAVAEQYKQRKGQLRAIFQDFHGKQALDKALQEIHVPVLLLWGDKDRLLHVSAVEVWKAGIKDIQVKVWPEIGHMPMMEIPSESADVYLEFLKEKS